MAIVSGYQKMKDYIKQSSGYKLLSRWANANTVECDDAQTVQSKIGGITGISSSLTANSSTQAASTQLTNQLYQNITQVNSEFQAWFGVTEDGQRGWKEQGADTVHPFNSFKFLAAVPYNTSRTSNGTPIPFDLSAYSGEVIIALAFIWAYGVSLDTTQITFSPEPEEYLYKAPDAYTMGGSWGYNVPFVIRLNVDKIPNKTLNVNHKSNGQMRGCQYFIFKV